MQACVETIGKPVDAAAAGSAVVAGRSKAAAVGRNGPHWRCCSCCCEKAGGRPLQQSNVKIKTHSITNNKDKKKYRIILKQKISSNWYRRKE
jgi:hypothetical protein